MRAFSYAWSVTSGQVTKMAVTPFDRSQPRRKRQLYRV